MVNGTIIRKGENILKNRFGFQKNKISNGEAILYEKKIFTKFNFII